MADAITMLLPLKFPQTTSNYTYHNLRLKHINKLQKDIEHIHPPNVITMINIRKETKVTKKQIREETKSSKWKQLRITVLEVTCLILSRGIFQRFIGAGITTRSWSQNFNTQQFLIEPNLPQTCILFTPIFRSNYNYHKIKNPNQFITCTLTNPN